MVQMILEVIIFCSHNHGVHGLFRYVWVFWCVFTLFSLDEFVFVQHLQSMRVGAASDRNPRSIKCTRIGIWRKKMRIIMVIKGKMKNQYKRNIFSVLKDILAYPSRTVLHNFPITSSNVSDNIETKWSDQYGMQNLPYFEAKSLWQLLFGQKVKQSLPICRNVFILNNQKILCCKVSRVTIVSIVFFHFSGDFHISHHLKDLGN